MAGKKKNTEVVSLQKYKRKGHLNIGTILFGIIFVYLVFTVLIYFTKDRVSVYEVREGSILKDRNLTGMVLRKETVVNAEKSGYVNYFVDDAQKLHLEPIFTPLRLPSSRHRRIRTAMKKFP